MEKKTLDQRIKEDLPQIYQLLQKQVVLKDIVESLEPISAAKELSEKLFGGKDKDDDWFALSYYGLPGYFTGDRKAKTVMVMLNPGNDVLANDNPFNTMRYIKNYGISLDTPEEFIRTYIKGYSDFGNHPTYKVDNFDMKQAVFLSAWDDTGVTIPKGFPDELITNSGKKISARVKKVVDKYWQEYVQHLKKNEIRDSESRAAAYKEIVGKIKNENELQEVREQLDILFLKEKATRNVLMEKLQLELIPYASRKFDTSTDNLEVVMPYLETLLDEIFRVVKNRKYVIFCSDFFEKLFDYASGKRGIEIEFVKRREPIYLEEKDKSDKEGKCMKAYCSSIKITYKGEALPAIIAHTFPNQALPNAYHKMWQYGKSCFDCWNEIEK